MHDADLIADLIRAGVAPDLVGRVADAVACARAEGAYRQGLEEGMAAQGQSVEEERRAMRRARNARYRETHKTSQASQETVETSHETFETPETSQADPSRARSSQGEALRASSVGFPQSSTQPSVAPMTAPRGAGERGTRLPSDWSPSQALAAFAQGLGFVGQKLDQAVAEFHDYWRGVPGQKGRKADWDATFRNRLRETAGRRGGSNGRGPDRSGRVDMGAVTRAVRATIEQEGARREAEARASAAGGDGWDLAKG